MFTLFKKSAGVSCKQDFSGRELSLGQPSGMIIDWEMVLTEAAKQMLQGGIRAITGATQQGVNGNLNKKGDALSGISSEKMEILQTRAKALGVPTEEYIHTLVLRFKPYVHENPMIQNENQLLEAVPDDLLVRIESTFEVREGEIVLKMYNGEIIDKISQFVQAYR